MILENHNYNKKKTAHQFRLTNGATHQNRQKAPHARSWMHLKAS